MNRLSAGIGVFVVNTICTLKCRKCITMTPYHDKAVHFPKEQICNDIDAFFEIFERVDHLDFEGGETLLHPEIAEVVRYALKYKNRFDRIHILTNGTLVPKRDLLEVCRGEMVVFLIDDYGPSLSVKKSELCDVLNEWEISYRMDTYWGDEQYYGGWIDLGDAQYKNYTEHERKKVYSGCRSGGGKYPYVKNGKMFVCEWQAAMMEHIPLIEREFVDLRNRHDIEKELDTIRRWEDNPVESCGYCKSFNVDSARIPAAEQLTLAEFNNPAMKIARADYNP